MVGSVEITRPYIWYGSSETEVLSRRFRVWDSQILVDFGSTRSPMANDAAVQGRHTTAITAIAEL